MVKTHVCVSNSQDFGLIHGKWPNGLHVRRITRIQDKLLWESYSDSKKSLRTRLTDASKLASSQYLNGKKMCTPLLDPSVNEYLLFHGCPDQIVNLIVHQGGNPLFSNAGGMFGAGLYMAENSSKASTYVPCTFCKRNACVAQDNPFSNLCDCPNQENIEFRMVIFRALLGHVHMCTQVLNKKKVSSQIFIV